MGIGRAWLGMLPGLLMVALAQSPAVAHEGQWRSPAFTGRSPMAGPVSGPRGPAYSATAPGRSPDMFRHDHNNARVHGGTRWEAERRWRNDHRRDDWDHRRREHHDHFRAHRGWSHDGFIEHHRHRHYGHFRYVPPVVIVAPPIMWSGSRLIAPVGQPQAFLSPDDDRPLWYYCDNPRGYYPQVADCPQGWQAVVPPTGTGY